VGCGAGRVFVFVGRASGYLWQMLLKKDEWIYRHANIRLFADPDSETGQYILNLVRFLEGDPAPVF
jgi:hypothetical protein